MDDPRRPEGTGSLMLPHSLEDGVLALRADTAPRTEGESTLAALIGDALGATLQEYQPQKEVRVLRDPYGHPFCLFTPGA
jgi:hypothetical protein